MIQECDTCQQGILTLCAGSCQATLSGSHQQRTDGRRTTRPSSSLLAMTWQPRRDVSVSPNARSSMSFSSSLGSCKSARAQTVRRGRRRRQRVRRHAASSRVAPSAVRVAESCTCLHAGVVLRVLHDNVAGAARQRALARALRAPAAASAACAEHACTHDGRAAPRLQVNVACVRHLQQVLAHRRAARNPLAVAVHERDVYAVCKRNAEG
jgi:hypothetical protein